MSTQRKPPSMAADGLQSAVSRALVLLGGAVVAAGALISVLGLSGVDAFDVSVKSFAFDSTSTGVAVIALGGALVAGVALDRPDGPGRYQPESASAAERRGRGLALLGASAMALGFILYVASILF